MHSLRPNTRSCQDPARFTPFEPNQKPKFKKNCPMCLGTRKRHIKGNWYCIANGGGYAHLITNCISCNQKMVRQNMPGNKKKNYYLITPGCSECTCGPEEPDGYESD